MTDWSSAIDECSAVSLDTNAVIYFLDQTAPYFDLVRQVFGRAEGGSLQIVLSALVETELLVGPLRDGNVPAAESVRLLLDHFPGLSVEPIDRKVAQTAAELRSTLALSTPDALIVAAAESAAVDAIIGNDRRCATRVTSPKYLCLSDFVTHSPSVD